MEEVPHLALGTCSTSPVKPDYVDCGIMDNRWTLLCMTHTGGDSPRCWSPANRLHWLQLAKLVPLPRNQTNPTHPIRHYQTHCPGSWLPDSAYLDFANEIWDWAIRNSLKVYRGFLTMPLRMDEWLFMSILMGGSLVWKKFIDLTDLTYATVLSL